MEDSGIFDVDDEVDLFCFYYIFILCIRNYFLDFVRGWNCYRLFFERNRILM